MNNNAVSIIIPCYNVEKFLSRCMKTVLSQTLTEIEIVLVDDGSPDNVPDICDEYARNDERVKVIHKQNEGLGYARNSGLEIATGEYVAFVDSDDYVQEDMFLTLYNEAKNSDADIVFCGFLVEDARGKWHRYSDYKENRLIEGANVMDYLLDMIACAPHIKTERKHAMSVWHGIYKRSLIEKNGIRFSSERDVVSEDLPFHVDVLLQSKRILCVPDCYYYYCLNDSSLTSTFKPEKYKKFRSLYFLLLEKMQGVPDAVLRIDRFFIGYTRSHILHLLNSDRDDKDLLLRDIVDDSVWKTIGSRYKPSYLPVYSRFFYWLHINQMIKLLVLYARVILIIKKIFGYKIG